MPKKIAIAMVLLLAACTPAALPPQHALHKQDNGGGPIGGASTPSPTPAPTVAPMDNGGGPIGGT